MKLRQALLVAVLAVLAGNGPAHADPAALARAERLLAAIEREGLAHGGAAVQMGAGALWQRPLGLARQMPDSADMPARTDTRYRIGSITKTMTAVMVMQLVEAGALRLEDPIARWFPTLPEAQRVTVEMLLRHRGGYGALESLPAFQTQWVFTPRSRDELVATIARLPRAFAPGERAVYSNAGYLLLAFIVEMAGGRPYPEALQQRIVQPLGLRHTAFDTGQPQPHDAMSYRWQDDESGATHEGRWVPLAASHLSVPHGAGGVVSTPGDLVLFMRGLFNGRLVKPATLARMQGLQDRFGLGLYRLPGPGPEAWGHEGQIDAFGSLLLHLPTTNTTLAWTGNAHRLPRDDITAALRRALFEPAAPVPTFAEREVPVHFRLEHVPRGGEAPPLQMTLRGNVPPLSWYRGVALQREPGDTTGRSWHAPLTLRLRDGMAAEYKYLEGDTGWERTPNRRLDGPNPAPRDVFDHDAARLALRDEVLGADARFFEAFHARNVDGMAAIFHERLEFFHDRNGLTHLQQTLEAFRGVAASGQRVTRTLLPGSEVQPLGDFGAAHLGRHRFCSRPESAPPEAAGCSVYRFQHIWQRRPAGWQLLRVLSLDH
jgi:D-alanyl-D-alanine carboxypeptidase